MVKTFCRFVPERMDDFAWESDRIAHRMYGPALITGEGTISSGVDVWVKSTRNMIINKWYKSGEYHADHGEGLDGYSVRPQQHAHPRLWRARDLGWRKSYMFPATSRPSG